MYRNDHTKNHHRHSSPCNPYETPPSRVPLFRTYHQHVRSNNPSPMSPSIHQSPSPISYRFDNSPILHYSSESWHTPKSWDSNSRRSTSDFSNMTYSGGTRYRKHNFNDSNCRPQFSHNETNSSRNSDIRSYVNSSMLENPWCELEQELEKKDNLERLQMTKTTVLEEDKFPAMIT